MAISPYVRKEDGLGLLFYSEPEKLRNAAFWALGVFYCGFWYAGGLAGLAAGIAALISVLIFSFYCRKKIGGATGDTLGASCELAEVIVALVLAVNVN